MRYKSPIAGLREQVNFTHPLTELSAWIFKATTASQFHFHPGLLLSCWQQGGTKMNRSGEEGPVVGEAAKEEAVQRGQSFSPLLHAGRTRSVCLPLAGTSWWAHSITFQSLPGREKSSQNKSFGLTSIV